MAFAEYARKSSEGDERQVQSIPDQQAVLARVAKQNGIDIAVHIEEDRSAKAPGLRPKFDAMVKMIERGQIDGILCWSSDRLFRNPVDYGKIAWLLQTGRLKCIRTPEHEYLPTDNVLLLAVEAGVATQYVIDLGKNVKRGLHEKAGRGWRPGVAKPGYLNIGQVEGSIEVRIIGPDPDRWSAIRRAWDDMLTGAYTVPQVLAMVNAQGYLSRPTRKHPAGPMTRSTLYKVFNDPFYYGCYSYGGVFIQGQHPAMVTKEEFDRVRRLIERPLKAQPQKHKFAFTGLIRCGVCGCLITAERKVKFFPTTGNRSEYIYYHCTGRKGCPKDSIPESLIEERVVKLLAEFTLPSEKARAWSLAVVERNKKDRRRPQTNEFNERRVAVAKAKEHLDGLIEMRARNELTAEEFQERKQRYQSELTRLTFDLRVAEEAEDQLNRSWKNAIDFAERAYQEFAGGQIRARRTIARLLSDDYVLTLGKLEITVDPLLDVFRTFEPPKTPDHMERSGVAEPISPALRRRLDSIRTQIISGKLSFEKLPPCNEIEAEP